MLPDIIPFIPHVLIEHFWGDQIIFDYLYCRTHSLVIFAVGFCIIALTTRSIPYIAGAWGLHILFDIFTHPKTYYPTPFLYPFDSPFWFALDYRSRWFLVTNYATIAGVFLTIIVIDKYLKDKNKTANTCVDQTRRER